MTFDYFCDRCGAALDAVPRIGMLCSCGGSIRAHDLPALHGITFADFRKEYRAHLDKYPDAESNIKYCELMTQTSRHDVSRKFIPKREISKTDKNKQDFD